MNTEEIERYRLEGERYIFSYEGDLWKYRPLDTSNMGWAKFYGTMTRAPYDGIWVRERSDEPEGKEIDIERAVLHCRRIELENLRASMNAIEPLATQAMRWANGQSWRWSSAEPLLEAAHKYATTIYGK